MRPGLTRTAVLGAIAATALSTFGCAYFNTFYSARKNFESAELQRSQQVDDPEARANAGQAALYDKAMESAAKVVLEYSKSKWVDDAMLLIGRSMLAKGDYVGAQEKFDELNTNFPKSDLRDQATYWSAVAADRDRRAVDAMVLYDSLLSAYPKSKERDNARLRRANLFLTRKEPERAIGDLRELAAIKGPLGYSAGLRLAEALFAQHDYAGARTEFLRVADRAPTEQLRLEARLRAGDCDEAAGDFAHAAESYLKLLRDSRTDEGRARARLRYGSALALGGDLDRGLTELKNVVEDYPRTAYAGEALFRTGYLQEVVRDDFVAASKAYESVSEQAPGSPFATQARTRRENLSQLAASLAASKDTTAAGRAAEASVRQAEHYLFQLGRPERALEEYEKAEREYPTGPLAPRAAFARGWVLARRLGRPADAKTAFESVVQRFPDSEEAKAARRLLANPADSTFANERLAGTAMQFPLVPGNPLYVPPPPEATSRSNRGASPARTIANPTANSAREDSLQARREALRAAQRRLVLPDSTKAAPPDTAKAAKPDTTKAARPDTTKVQGN